MAANSNVERLTPLDVLMPRTYVATLLTFRTTQSTSAVLRALQTGLDALFRQLPWLSGRVFPTTLLAGRTATLEIQWDTNEDSPSLIDKGSISAAYETLSIQGMPPAAIPPGVWPVSGMMDDSVFSRGVPVFITSIFRFADNQGVGLCICMHHNAVDATGFAEVLRLWAQNITGPELPYPSPVDDRLTRLSKALRTDLNAVSALSPDDILASHPEYSRTPPVMPASFPSCTSKLFAIPITRNNSIKELLGEHMSDPPTTNSVLCAFIWSAITHVRKQRNPALANETSRLATAVNGRRRVAEGFSTSECPYFGNAILYSLTELPVEHTTAFFDQASGQSLANICGIISRSQSSAQINSRHIAEVYSLVDQIEDYRTIFVGWDLFGARDLTITSWANLGLYDMDFGSELGKPDFVRMRYTEADGVALILPRKRAPPEFGTCDEVLEFTLMLREDDMDALEQDSTWRAFMS